MNEEKEKQIQFERDFKKLIRKHNLTCHEVDHYDSDENICGNSIYIQIDGVTVYESLDSMVERLKQY